MSKSHIQQDYFRSIIFGAEDALVSTTGLVVGVSVGINEQRIILLTGLVALAVEALSMGAGQFLSERAVHQLERKNKREHKDSLIVGSVLMFFSYMLAGLLPIIPVLIYPAEKIILASTLSGLVGLFVLGLAKAMVTGVPKFRSALEIMIIGGIAALLGIIVGFIFRV